MSVLPPASDGTSSLTARAAWLVLAKGFAFALSFGVPLVLVRQLSLSEFGLYKQAFLLIGTAVTLLPVGFAMNAFYFLPREPARRGEVALNILLFHVFVAAAAGLALVAFPNVLAVIFHDPDLASYGALIGAVVLLWVSSSFLEMVALANQEARLAAGLIVTLHLMKALSLLSAAVWFASLRALFVAALVHGALQTAIALFYLGSRFHGFWRRIDWRLMKSQLTYALPYGLAVLLWWAQMELHSYFVANRFDAATYAIYAIGCFQLPLIAIFNESVASVMIPHVSRLRVDDRRKEIVVATARTIRNLAVIHFPLCGFLLVSGREFITVLFTAQYLASWPIFAVNLTLIPLGIIAIACDPVIRAYPEHRYYLVGLRSGLIVLLVGGLWFAIDRFGLVGAISVVVGINLVERVLVAIKVGRILGVGRSDTGLLKPVGKLAAAAVAASLAAAVGRILFLDAGALLALAGSAAIFAVVYAALVLLLNVPTAEEREAVRGRVEGFLNRLWRRSADEVA